MGDGLSKDADRPLSLDELKAMWKKHDTNASGTLKRAEVTHLMDDIRRRYGLPDKLDQEFVDEVFEELDGEQIKAWTWHDFRLLGGPTYNALKRKIQRKRVRSRQRHHRAARDKKKEKEEKDAGYLGALDRAWGDAIGRGAETAKLEEEKETESSHAPVELIFHPMRAERLKKAEGSLTFNPFVEVRVTRGDPRRGCAERRDEAALAEEAIYVSARTAAETGNTTEPTWEEPVRVSFNRKKGLYVHVIVYDQFLGYQVQPLADTILTLDEAEKYQRVQKPRWFALSPIDIERSEPGGSLIAQWGGEEVPKYMVTCHVIRAEDLPEENILVDVALYGYQSECILAQGRSNVDSGPHPDLLTAIPLECMNETKMELECTVSKRTFGINEEKIAKLKSRIRQETMLDADVASRFDLVAFSTETKIKANAFIVLAFGVLPWARLLIRPSTAANVTPKEGATSFNPFVDVKLLTRDPRLKLGGPGPIIKEGTTETLSNVLGDPHWETPIVFEFAEEPSMFIHITICDSSSTLGDPDKLADLVVAVKDAIRLQAAPLERKYELKLLVPTQKHQDPWLFLSFGDCTGPVPRDESALNSSKMPIVKTSGAAKVVPDFVVDPETGRVVHGGVPCLGVPDLGTYLQTHDQHVPAILQNQSPFRPPVRQEAFVPPIVAEAMHHQTGTGQEQGSIASLVAQRGGNVEGTVPVSFMSSASNPHFQWMFQGKPGR